MATGTHGGHHFEVFAAVDGPLDRGLVRGSYDGQTVHLDLRATPGNDAHIAAVERKRDEHARLCAATFKLHRNVDPLHDAVALSVPTSVSVG